MTGHGSGGGLDSGRAPLASACRFQSRLPGRTASEWSLGAATIGSRESNHPLRSAAGWKPQPAPPRFEGNRDKCPGCPSSLPYLDSRQGLASMLRVEVQRRASATQPDCTNPKLPLLDSAFEPLLLG